MNAMRSDRRERGFRRRHRYGGPIQVEARETGQDGRGGRRCSGEGDRAHGAGYDRVPRGGGGGRCRGGDHFAQ
jgi:hypothetical protein